MLHLFALSPQHVSLNVTRHIVMYVIEWLAIGKYATPWSACQQSEYQTSDETYRKTSNISRTFIGNKIVDHSDVVGASPVGAAPTTSSFST